MSAVIVPGDHLTSAVDLVRALRDQHNEITASWSGLNISKSPARTARRRSSGAWRL
jgi:hypothetical protein